MKGAVRRIVSCMNVGEEECKEVSLRKCKYVKTRENEKKIQIAEEENVAI